MDDATMLPAGEAAPTADTGDFEIEARKIVRNSYLDLETKEFDQALAGIQQLVEQNGGYLESQSVNGRSLRDENSRQERYATLTARVPAENLDSVVTQVGELWQHPLPERGRPGHHRAVLRLPGPPGFPDAPGGAAAGHPLQGGEAGGRDRPGERPLGCALPDREPHRLPAANGLPGDLLVFAHHPQ